MTARRSHWAFSGRPALSGARVGESTAGRRSPESDDRRPRFVCLTGGCQGRPDDEILSTPRLPAAWRFAKGFVFAFGHG